MYKNSNQVPTPFKTKHITLNKYEWNHKYYFENHNRVNYKAVNIPMPVYYIVTIIR